MKSELRRPRVALEPFRLGHVIAKLEGKSQQAAWTERLNGSIHVILRSSGRQEPCIKLPVEFQGTCIFPFKLDVILGIKPHVVAKICIGANS